MLNVEDKKRRLGQALVGINEANSKDKILKSLDSDRLLRKIDSGTL